MNDLYSAGNAGDHGILVFGKVKFDESSGRINFLNILQQNAKHLDLTKRLAGKAQGVTQRETRIDCPRWLYLAGDFLGQADRNGRNTGRFNDALDQPHGLIAEASGRREKGNIDAVFI